MPCRNSWAGDEVEVSTDGAAEQGADDSPSTPEEYVETSTQEVGKRESSAFEIGPRNSGKNQFSSTTSEPTQLPAERPAMQNAELPAANMEQLASTSRLVRNTYSPQESFAQATNAIQSVVEFGPLAPVSQVATALASDIRAFDQEPVQIITVDLHPAELGQLKIRVEQISDQLTAHIVASEVASADLLMRDRGFLQETLAELGFEDANVDISYENNSQQTSQDQDDGIPLQFNLNEAEVSGESSNANTDSITNIQSQSTSRINFVA